MKFDPKDLSFEFETKEEADAACDLAERIVFKGNVPLTGPEAPELIQTVNAAIMAQEGSVHRLDGNPIIYWSMVLPFRIMVGAQRLAKKADEKIFIVMLDNKTVQDPKAPYLIPYSFPFKFVEPYREYLEERFGFSLEDLGLGYFTEGGFMKAVSNARQCQGIRQPEKSVQDWYKEFLQGK